MDKYIIVSLKHSKPEFTMFWRPNGIGYTCSLVNAGVYSKEQVVGRPYYYNDGLNTVAVPLTRAALATLGLYTVVADSSMLDKFMNRKVTERQG